MRRGLLLVLGLAATGCQPPAWYVDRIEGGTAVLIAADGTSREVSTQTLPPDAGEGSWIAGGRRLPAQEREVAQRIAAKRRALAAADDGSTIVLGR